MYICVRERVGEKWLIKTTLWDGTARTYLDLSSLVYVVLPAFEDATWTVWVWRLRRKINGSYTHTKSQSPGHS